MKRAGGAILPKVNLIDMRAEAGNALSAMLIAKMKQHLSSGKQVMLFINRRGYAPVYFCTFLSVVQRLFCVWSYHGQCE
jgi:primosomal protein N' (replication factor Y)